MKSSASESVKNGYLNLECLGFSFNVVEILALECLIQILNLSCSSQNILCI